MNSTTTKVAAAVLAAFGLSMPSAAALEAVGTVFRSFSELSSNLVSGVSAAAPDMYPLLAGDLGATISNALSFSRAGWPSAQLVRFADSGPETNAVLVPLQHVDIHRPGPRSEWKIVHSDAEVRAGIRRNQLARILVLCYILESLDDSATTPIPFSEELLAVGEIWGSDLVPSLRGRGTSDSKRHREIDGLSDIRPLFEMFLLSNNTDPATKQTAASLLADVDAIPPGAGEEPRQRPADGLERLAETVRAILAQLSRAASGRKTRSPPPRPAAPSPGPDGDAFAAAPRNW